MTRLNNNKITSTAQSIGVLVMAGFSAEYDNASFCEGGSCVYIKVGEVKVNIDFEFGVTTISGLISVAKKIESEGVSYIADSEAVSMPEGGDILDLF